MKTSLKKLTLALALTAATSVSFADLYVYNGQHKNGGVEQAAKAFTEKTGIKIQFKAAKSPELVALVKEEGDKSPADILITESSAAFLDLGHLGLLAQIDDATLKNVEGKNVVRSADKTFLPLGIRSRVVAYNPEKVKEADIPATLIDLVKDPAWKGRFGYHAGSSALVVQVADHIKLHGKEETKTFLEQMKANGKGYTHMAGLRLVSDGELDLMIMNQYYLQRLINERGGDPQSVNAKIHYMRNGEADAALSYTSAGILKSSKNQKEAQQFLAYLSSVEGNETYTSKSFEWPTNPKAKVQVEYLESLDSLVPPTVSENTFEELKEAKDLIKEVGLKNL